MRSAIRESNPRQKIGSIQSSISKLKLLGLHSELHNELNIECYGGHQKKSACPLCQQNKFKTISIRISSDD